MIRTYKYIDQYCAGHYGGRHPLRNYTLPHCQSIFRSATRQEVYWLSLLRMNLTITFAKGRSFFSLLSESVLQQSKNTSVSPRYALTCHLLLKEQFDVGLRENWIIYLRNYPCCALVHIYTQRFSGKPASILRNQFTFLSSP